MFMSSRNTYSALVIKVIVFLESWCDTDSVNILLCIDYTGSIHNYIFTNWYDYLVLYCVLVCCLVVIRTVVDTCLMLCAIRECIHMRWAKRRLACCTHIHFFLFPCYGQPTVFCLHCNTYVGHVTSMAVWTCIVDVCNNT